MTSRKPDETDIDEMVERLESEVWSSEILGLHRVEGWDKAYELKLYTITGTAREEAYGLASQPCRSATSISGNIAGGYRRALCKAN